MNKNYSIEDKIWEVCLKTNFINPENECTYLVTYVFNTDGTFFEYSKSASDSTQKIQSSREMKWKLEDNLLTINVQFENLERTIQHKINWVDKSTFYTVETNSINVKTETRYKAIEESKK